ncbi:Protein NETWORKED 3C [Linum grandiflorum]
MLKVIEQDADSFAQRAEMYYKKRPELINMVEDFYRTHRSLVEEYDQLKSETRGSRRRLLSLTSSLSVDFDRGNRSTMSMMNNHHQACDCKSTMNKKEEMKTLKEEAEELKEENRIQKEELWQKDEEKREVIRQLSLGMEMLRSENMELRKKQQQQQSSSPVQRRSPFEFGKLKDTIFTKLFHGSPTPKVIIAAPSQI